MHFFNPKKGLTQTLFDCELTPKKFFFQPSVPIWDALTFSALCSVPKVHVRRIRCAIVGVLLLGALHNPVLSTQDAIRRVSPGQRLFTAVPPPPAAALQINKLSVQRRSPSPKPMFLARILHHVSDDWGWSRKYSRIYHAVLCVT